MTNRYVQLFLPQFGTIVCFLRQQDSGSTMNGTGMGAVFPLVLGSARLRSKSPQLGMSVSSKEALPKLPKDDTCKCVQTKADWVRQLVPVSIDAIDTLYIFPPSRDPADDFSRRMI